MDPQPRVRRPQCGCSREPADCTEKYAEPITIVFTSGPSEASSFADRGAQAPGCSEPDIASVTSDQRPLTSAGEVVQKLLLALREQREPLVAQRGGSRRAACA